MAVGSGFTGQEPNWVGGRSGQHIWGEERASDHFKEEEGHLVTGQLERAPSWAGRLGSEMRAGRVGRAGDTWGKKRARVRTEGHSWGPGLHPGAACPSRGGGVFAPTHLEGWRRQRSATHPGTVRSGERATRGPSRAPPPGPPRRCPRRCPRRPRVGTSAPAPWERLALVPGGARPQPVGSSAICAHPRGPASGPSAPAPGVCALGTPGAGPRGLQAFGPCGSTCDARWSQQRPSADSREPSGWLGSWPAGRSHPLGFRQQLFSL